MSSMQRAINSVRARCYLPPVDLLIVNRAALLDDCFQCVFQWEQFAFFGRGRRLMHIAHTSPFGVVLYSESAVQNTRQYLRYAIGRMVETGYTSTRLLEAEGVEFIAREESNPPTTTCINILTSTTEK